jgi:hypothetical protein
MSAVGGHSVDAAASVEVPFTSARTSPRQPTDRRPSQFGDVSAPLSIWLVAVRVVGRRALCDRRGGKEERHA